MYAGLRASGKKADLSLLVADVPAVAAGVFTTNVMCAAPVQYDRKVLASSDTVKAVRLFLIGIPALLDEFIIQFSFSSLLI